MKRPRKKNYFSFSFSVVRKNMKSVFCFLPKQSVFSKISLQILRTLSIIFAISAVSLILVVGYAFFVKAKLGFWTYAYDKHIPFSSSESALEILLHSLDDYVNTPLTVVVDNKRYGIHIQELGVVFDRDRISTSIEELKTHSTLDKTFDKYALYIPFSIDETVAVRKIRETIPELQTGMKETNIVLENDAFLLQEGHDGYSFDTDVFLDKLSLNLYQLNSQPIEIKIKKMSPQVSYETGQKTFEHISQLIQNTLILTEKENTWNIPLDTVKDWFFTEPKGSVLEIAFHDEKIEQYLQTHVSSSFEVSSQDIILSFDENKAMQVSGVGRNGYVLEKEKTIQQIKENILQENFSVELITKREKAKVIQPENEYGITDFLGEGSSSFAGSPANRIHNITLGATKFHNLLIPPGEKVSFLSFLGNVGPAEGYKAELVIKQGGRELKKEWGGGICQVSSTLYRATLNTGMDINTRRNHSIIVSYYYPLGLDATIYDPSQDFVFTNNTSSYILIQNEIDTENQEIAFRFWGTDDGRMVRLEGPFKYGWLKIPDPVYIDTTALSPGQILQKQKGISGVSVDWKRFITFPNQEEKSEIFHSQYRAVPYVYQRGVDQ